MSDRIDQTPSEGLVRLAHLLTRNAERSPELLLNAHMIARILETFARGEAIHYAVLEYLLVQREGRPGDLRAVLEATSAYRELAAGLVFDTLLKMAEMHPEIDTELLRPESDA